MLVGGMTARCLAQQADKATTGEPLPWITRERERGTSRICHSGECWRGRLGCLRACAAAGLRMEKSPQVGVAGQMGPCPAQPYGSGSWPPVGGLAMVSKELA